MSFAPVRLGNTVLEAETAAADRKSCRRFGPCGVGEKALYLNDLLIDRHFYVGFGSVRRVFKRVAMSQGGFSGKGAFGSIPYLVVQYDDGQEKQCTFKREEDVDELLAYLGQVHPEIPRLSVGGEQRLAKKAQQEASRYLEELTPQAQSAMANVLPEDFPLPARYAHPIVLDRMIRILREGRAQSKEEALDVLKADLKALTADVQVEQEEHDEVVVIKPLFLVSDYQ